MTPRAGSTTIPPPLTGFFTFFVPTRPLPFLSLGNAPMDDFWWEVMLQERSQWSLVGLCSRRARLGWAEFRPLSPSCPTLCPQEYLLTLTQPGCLTQTRDLLPLVVCLAGSFSSEPAQQSVPERDLPWPPWLPWSLVPAPHYAPALTTGFTACVLFNY